MLGPGRHPTRSGLTAHSRIHLFVCGALVRTVSGGPNWQSSAREPRSHRNPIERSTSEMTTNVLVTFYTVLAPIAARKRTCLGSEKCHRQQHVPLARLAVWSI